MTDLVRQNATSTSEFAAPLPAGVYLVSDPCYLFSNNKREDGRDLWAEWLNAAWEDVDANLVRILDATVSFGDQTFRVASSGTAYGDGVYEDQHGHSYSVDAGEIGAVPLEAIPFLSPEYAGKTGAEIAAAVGARLVTFDVPFHVSYSDEEGTISIGHIEIVTDPQDGGW